MSTPPSYPVTLQIKMNELKTELLAQDRTAALSSEEKNAALLLHTQTRFHLNNSAYGNVTAQFKWMFGLTEVVLYSFLGYLIYSMFVIGGIFFWYLKSLNMCLIKPLPLPRVSPVSFPFSAFLFLLLSIGTLAFTLRILLILCAPSGTTKSGLTRHSVPSWRTTLCSATRTMYSCIALLISPSATSTSEIQSR